jgi:hypothetical protein
MGVRTSVVCSAKLGYLIALVKSFSTSKPSPWIYSTTTRRRTAKMIACIVKVDLQKQEVILL